MTTAVIGATGRVGSEIVRGLLARGDAVAALVRDPGKARRVFGEPGGLQIRAARLDDPRDLTGALDGVRRVFIAMGSVGIEGVLQRIAIGAAAQISSVGQVTRLSVLNASADSPGINQRAHDSIDRFAASTAVPYSTIRPAIFSASLLAAAREVRASRTWSGCRRPDGPDRPSRRGQGRAARAHRPGAVGHPPRPDRTGPPVVARSARCIRQNSASPSPSRSRPSRSSSSASPARGTGRDR